MLEEDLYLASKIHRALLPQTIPEIEGFEVEVRSLAARNIGGDYYDFLPGADSQTFRVVIADVMGHGLPAGLLMSNLQGALRILSSDIGVPGPLVTRLNQWLCRNVPVTKFVSMVCLNLEKTSGKETQVTYTNAGHCLPILIRSDGSGALLAGRPGERSVVRLSILAKASWKVLSMTNCPAETGLLKRRCSPSRLSQATPVAWPPGLRS